MTFASLLGNEELKAAWQHALHGRFPQSILLTGPKGIGKLTAARVLTMALLCESTGEKPCGQCAACRKVEQNYHSDVTCIDAGDAEIKVDTARRIRSECAVYPGDSDRRIFLIRHAQNMNAAAQNALLKLLEEPPEYAFFILMTENESAILPTILSRCTQYAMVPLNTGCVMQLLRRQYPDKDSAVLQSAAAGCQGIAGDALAALSDEAEEMTQLAGEFLRALECRQELGLLQAAENCSGLSRQQFSHVLTALRTALRDAIFCARGIPSPLLPALSEQTQAVSRTLTVRQLLALYDWMGELDERISRNPSMALLTGCLAAGSFERIQ